MNYGLLKSKLTGDEHHFYKTQPVDSNFMYSIFDTIDQGKDPICAACAATVFLKWNYNKDFNYYNLFDNAGGTKEGISFIQMLKYLRSKGLIMEYALVHSEQALKTAITINGPCLAGMTVRDSKKSNFWDGTKQEGMHGVAIIGWNDKGFIIKNSWGDDWGKHGTTILPHERFSEFKEIWTVIA